MLVESLSGAACRHAFVACSGGLPRSDACYLLVPIRVRLAVVAVPSGAVASCSVATIGPRRVRFAVLPRRRGGVCSSHAVCPAGGWVVPP